eukprot:g2062.t1
MAKRLYSRARRAKLSGAVSKWKTVTVNDRNLEEHTNAVAAMSNWAARIAGGRVLKERFQQWSLFTQTRILIMNHKLSSLKSAFLRFEKTYAALAFQHWKYATNESMKTEVRNALTKKHLDLQRKHANDRKYLSHINHIRSIRSCILRLVKIHLFQGFQKWKYYVNMCITNEIHQNIFQKETELRQYYSNEIDTLQKHHGLTLSNLKHDYMQKHENMVDSHTKEVASIRDEHSLALITLKDSHAMKINSITKQHREALDKTKIKHVGIDNKYRMAMNKLKHKYTKYWNNLNKAHIFRVWRENVLSIHLQRNRAQSALYVFRKYNQMHKKYIFTRWYKFTQHQKYKRGLFTHVFGNHLRRKLFLSFHFWHRRKMQSEYEVLCNTTRHAVAVSLRRQLQSRRLRSIIKMWRVRVSRDVHKRRTILGLLKWKHYHNITTAWRKLRDFATHRAHTIAIQRKHCLIACIKSKMNNTARLKYYFISWKEAYMRNSFIHASDTAHMNYIHNTLRRHLNTMRRSTLSKCMSKWVYYASDRRRKRLRVIWLMRTSRIAMYRLAIRLWKVFVHSDRISVYKAAGHDRLILSKLRNRSRLHLRKCLYAWHKYLLQKRYCLSLFISLLKSMQNSLFRQAFSRWSYCTGIMRRNEAENLQKMRLLRNYIGSKRYSVMKRMTDNWVLYTKLLLERRGALRGILVSKRKMYLQTGFKIWHGAWYKDTILHRILVRMSMIVSRQRYALAMMKWKQALHSYKIAEACKSVHEAKKECQLKHASSNKEFKAAEDKWKEKENIYLQEVAKLEHKMRILSSVASKQINEVELKLVNDLEKKNKESEILQNTLEDKEIRLQAAEENIIILQEELERSREKLASAYSQVEHVRQNAEGTNKYLQNILKEKESTIAKTKHTFEKVIQQKNEMLENKITELLQMQAAADEGKKIKAVHDFLHQKYDDTVLQIKDLKAEKAKNNAHLKTEHEKVVKEQKHQYEHVILRLNNEINRISNKFSMLTLKSCLRILPCQVANEKRRGFEIWKFHTVKMQTAHAMKINCELKMNNFIDASKEQLILLSQNHSKLRQACFDMQNNYNVIQKASNALKYMLLDVSEIYSNIISTTQSFFAVCKNGAETFENSIKTLEKQNTTIQNDNNTLELELKLFKKVFNEKQEESSKLKLLLHRSEELMKVTQNQLEALESASKSDASQSIISQQLLKEITEKDRLLEASKKIGIKTMKELNEAKAKIQKLKEKQANFLDGVDNNMELLRERLVKTRTKQT